MLEGEIRDSIYSLQLPSLKMGLSDQQRGGACDKSPIQESGVVSIDVIFSSFYAIKVYICYLCIRKIRG